MKTLHQLIGALEAHSRSSNPEDVLYLLSLFNACEGAGWEQYISGPGNKPVFQNDHFRLVLIGWDGYAQSKKHGHPEGGCLLKVLSGSLLETRFDPFDPSLVSGRHYFSRGDISYIHDALAYHIVENPHPEPAVSLHLYSPGAHVSRAIQANALMTEGVGA